MPSPPSRSIAYFSVSPMASADFITALDKCITVFYRFIIASINVMDTWPLLPQNAHITLVQCDQITASTIDIWRTVTNAALNNTGLDCADQAVTHISQYLATDNFDYSTSQALPTELHKLNRTMFPAWFYVVCYCDSLDSSHISYIFCENGSCVFSFVHNRITVFRVTFRCRRDPWFT